MSHHAMDTWSKNVHKQIWLAKYICSDILQYCVLLTYILFLEHSVYFIFSLDIVF